jgi:hypothetical protein
MHFKRGQRALALATALVALFSQQHSVTLAATACCEGTIWLKASKDTKTAYVDGYVEGIMHGFGQGCLAGTKGVQASAPGIEGDPFRKCLAKGYTFSRTTDEYVKLITDFYRKYPDDRDMPISEVLVKLSQGLGFEQIHLEPKPHRAGSSSKVK